MIKNLAVQSKSIKYHQTAGEQQYTEQKIVAKMLTKGKRCGEIDHKASHKRVKNAKFSRN